MAWGAINELTTLTGYRRLAALAGHPVLSELLERITRDESRHFFFYYRQAQLRLRRPEVPRVALLLVDRFWAAVCSGVFDIQCEWTRRRPYGGRDNQPTAGLRDGRRARQLGRPLRSISRKLRAGAAQYRSREVPHVPDGPGQP